MLKVWYGALTQDYLDLRVRTSSDVVARIIERPGLWMKPEDQEQVLADLRAIARRTVASGDLDYGVLTGSPDRFERSILTILYDRTSGTPIAFNALAVMEMQLHGKPAEVLHMGLVMVDPGVRSQGFSWVLYGLTCLILFFRNQMRPLWLSNVTQVPAIVGMVAGTFSNVYPTAKPGGRRSFSHVLLAREIMAHHRHVFGVGAEASFDEERFVIANAYTGGSDGLKKSFAAVPKHRDSITNDFCSQELDYERGDDLLQICQLTLESASGFALKNVPRRSLPAVAGALAIVALNQVFLPMLHWLSPDRAFGILRPRYSAGERQ